MTNYERVEAVEEFIRYLSMAGLAIVDEDKREMSNSLIVEDYEATLYLTD